MVAISITLLLVLPCVCYYADDSYFPTRTLKAPYVIRREYDESETYDYPSFSEWLRQKQHNGGKKGKHKKKKRAKKTTIYTILPKFPTFNKTVFSVIREKQNKATKTSEKKYPWIAQVVHSRDKNKPVMCTAACIHERIFVTAGRCLYAAQVFYTNVIYNNARLQSIAHVFADTSTKTMYDDFGFIVVKNYTRKWDTVKVFSKTDDANFARTDQNYFWFAKMIKDSAVFVGEVEGKVVGYVDEELYEIKVYSSPFLCQHFYNTDMVLSKDFKSDNYFVPCYHTCTLQKGYDKMKCTEYLAGEGHVMIEKTTSKLIGIATWRGYSDYDVNLPVGMAMPNSKDFYRDYDCARKISKEPDDSYSFTNIHC